jgi:hypothetical protein
MKRSSIWLVAAAMLLIGSVGCGKSDDTGFQAPPKGTAATGDQPIVSGAESKPQGGDPSSAGASFGGGKGG